MREPRRIALLSALILVAFVVPTQAFDHDDYDGKHHGFTERSLKGTYYIPCACEGNDLSINPFVGTQGGSIHVAGMGKAEFDGKGRVTITQQNVYIETTNSGVVRIVQDGVILPPPLTGEPAQFSGSYKLVGPKNEGFGQIYGEFFPDDRFPPEDDPNTPSFLITKAVGGKAIEIYLILPQNFFVLGGDPVTLIHVTATLRDRHIRHQD